MKNGYSSLLFDDNVFVDVIPSPLNYQGGKYRLLSQILPLFPENVDTFVDLFCGGCNVGINTMANRVLFNDCDQILIGLLRTFQRLDFNEFLQKVEDVISSYGLSNSCEYGYDFYDCNGSR